MTKVRKYQNFDLEFYRAADGLRVKARSPGGEAEQKVSLPFRDEEARQFLLSFEKHGRDSEAVKKFGGALFEAVFQGEILSLFKSRLAVGRAKNKGGLRVRLHLKSVPELAVWPWEFLYEAGANQFFCLDHHTPVVRYLDLAKPILPLHAKPPLRILVMISSPLTLLHLNVDEEKARLQTALAPFIKCGLLEVRWLEQATVVELQKLLRSSVYHVFHFIGHSDFDEQTQQGWLAFEDETEDVARIDAEKLAAMLNNHPSLRLVVLNSCAGAKTTTTNPFAGTAATLVQKGIPAVAAMQFPISDNAAVKFAEVFYSSLADGMLVETAVTEARVALFSGNHGLEWSTPVLFMRASNGMLFDFHKRALKRPSKKALVLYAVITLVFAALSVFMLSIVRKETPFELEVFATHISFSLTGDNDEESIPLLSSGLWTNKLSVTGFQKFSFQPANFPAFQNPLVIAPLSEESKIIFFASSPELSIQDFYGTPGSHVNLQRNASELSVSVRGGSEALYLKLSLPEEVVLVLQNCSVADAAGYDITHAFNDSTRVRLPIFARALSIRGANSALQVRIGKASVTAQEQAEFVHKQVVENLDFAKITYRGGQMERQSTVDSLFVTRSFPLENRAFSSRGAGDLEITSVPNRFALYDLKETPQGFKMRAQARLQSLLIGRGITKEELVPGYLVFITQNPTTSLLITVLVWIISVGLPTIISLKRQNQGE
ncbi:CHAT domain-containing protein [candidate division KSB1 bacterium]|nr:CHAT domain-containing protein [candidate division KSB1 bacterium]